MRKCENCHTVFNTAGNLNVHMANKSFEIQCNLCDKTLKSAGYLEKHISSNRVQTRVVKTSEGHKGLFPSTELRNDLHCSLCDFIAPKASKVKRHMVKHNPKPAKVEERCENFIDFEETIEKFNDFEETIKISMVLKRPLKIFIGFGGHNHH